MARRQSAEQVLDIRGFKGLNSRELQGQIDDNQLVTANNVDLGRHGEISKRKGFVRKYSGGGTLGTQVVNIIGYYRTTTVTQLIAKAGNNLYYSTDGGVTWTLIGTWNNIEFGIQYLNIFYMVRKDDTIVQWDGATASAIVGSPSGTHCRVFKDRLFVLNTLGSSTTNSRLYFSKPGDFTATGWPSTNFIDVNPGDGDVLVSQHNVQDTLIIFKSKSTWVLYASGDPVLWVLRNLSPQIGCTSKYTTHEFEGQLYFLSAIGVHRTTGTSIITVSNDISPILQEQVLATSFLNRSYAVIWEEKYILSLEYYPTSPTWDSFSLGTWNDLFFSTQTWDNLSAQYQLFVYHLRPEGWTTWSVATNSFITFTNMVPVDESSSLRGVYFGSRLGLSYVDKFGQEIYTDATFVYPCYVLTKEFDFGELSYLKKSKLVVLEVFGTSDVIVDIAAEGNTRVSKPITPITGGRNLYKIAGPGYFRVMQILVSSGDDVPFVLYGLNIRFNWKNGYVPETV